MLNTHVRVDSGPDPFLFDARVDATRILISIPYLCSQVFD